MLGPALARVATPAISDRPRAVSIEGLRILIPSPLPTMHTERSIQLSTLATLTAHQEAHRLAVIALRQQPRVCARSECPHNGTQSDGCRRAIPADRRRVTESPDCGAIGTFRMGRAVASEA